MPSKVNPTGRWVIRNGQLVWLPPGTIDEGGSINPPQGPAGTGVLEPPVDTTQPLPGGTQSGYPLAPGSTPAEILDYVNQLASGYSQAPWQGGAGSDLWGAYAQDIAAPKPADWQAGVYQPPATQPPEPTLPQWSQYGALTSEEATRRALELVRSPEFQLKLPSAWQVRQMAAPAAEANAMAQSRALMETGRQMREMGGPGVSGAALRQTALGNIAQARSTAESEAASNILAAQAGITQTGLSGALSVQAQTAAQEMATAAQRYATDVGAATDVWGKRYEGYFRERELEFNYWNAQEERRFGAWRTGYEEYGANRRAAMAGQTGLLTNWTSVQSQWIANWLAAYKLFSESEQPYGTTEQQTTRADDLAAKAAPGTEVGQTQIFAGVTYTWDGTAWVKKPSTLGDGRTRGQGGVRR